MEETAGMAVNETAGVEVVGINISGSSQSNHSLTNIRMLWDISDEGLSPLPT